MGECKDCKWWDEGAVDTVGYGICDLPIVVSFDLPEVGQVKVYVVSYGEDHADLVTSYEFGCLEFMEDSEVVEFEEIVAPGFESRYQLGYTARGRAWEHNWREFGGTMEDHDYGWHRVPEKDKAKRDA